MSKEIIASAEMPAPAPRDLRDPDPRSTIIVQELVAFWPSDNSCAVLRREPTQLEQGHLRMRQKDLHMLLRGLAVNDREKAGRVIATMFLGFPNMRQTNIEGNVAAYLAALQNFPLFAIEEACADVIQRRRWIEINPDFAPTAPRMVELATVHTAPLRSELARIEKTLTAETIETPITHDERERVKLKLKQLAETMIERDRIARREMFTHQAVVLKEIGTKQILDEYRRLGIDPVYADADKKILLSPELAGKTKTEQRS